MAQYNLFWLGISWFSIFIDIIDAKRREFMFQAEPPTIVVATIMSLCQMLEKHIFKLESMQVLVIDEVTGQCFWMC